MPIVDVTCPSGLVIRLRNMKAKEMALLADDEDEADKKKAVNRRSKKVNPALGILQGCIQEVLDVGPYAAYGAAPGVMPVKDAQGRVTPGPGALPWDDLLICDWFFAITRVRAATWGDDYEFRVRCRDKACKRHKKLFTWAVPLSGLAIKDLPEASRQRVREKNLIFDFTLAGQAAKFKLQQWRDMANQRDLTEIPKKEIFLAQCADRLIYVAGVDVTQWEGLLAWVGELDLPDVVGATQTYEEVDGGIETNTLAICPECGLEFDIAVPFAATSFLLPDKKTPGGKPMAEETS